MSSVHAVQTIMNHLNPAEMSGTVMAIDFHTGTTGLDAAAFPIGDMRIPEVKTMMLLYPVPTIWDNPVYPSVLHNAYVATGIPCFTPEIGAARRLDLAMIPIFVEGTLNVFKPYGLIPGAIGRTALDSKVYIGKNAVPALSTQGGLIELLVKMDAQVSPGPKLAIQGKAFGEVLAGYTSPIRGRIASLRTDATSEPGNVLFFFILTNDGPAAGSAPYSE